MLFSSVFWRFKPLAGPRKGKRGQKYLRIVTTDGEFSPENSGACMGKTVIFDLDGTLADTGADLIAAANACFRAMGHDDVLDPVRDKPTGMKGGRAMLALGFERLNGAVEAQAIDREYPNLLAHYSQNIHVETRLYPGAVAAMARLAAKGLRVGICTNKPEALADKLLQSLGMRDMFHALVGGDSLPVRKPDPTPYLETVRRAGGDVAQSLMIGDTVTDHKTARALGVPSVLVTFGPDGDAVAALEPDALLHHYDDLDGIVSKLLGSDS